MKIRVKRHYSVEYYNKISVTLNYDSVGSSFAFQFYFDPNNQAHKELFQPGHYHQLDISDENELLLTGWMINHTFNSSSEKSLCSISGFSLPGVLEDSNVPVDLYPLQSDGKTLLEIANHLVSKFPFSIAVDSRVSARANEVIEQSTAKETDTIYSYLTSLCKQKNIILSHTPEGNLLLTLAKTKSTPIHHFEQGDPNVSMSLAFKGRDMHSHITVLKQASVDTENAGESTVRNPFVPFVFRPKVVVQDSGNDIDTLLTAQNSLASELKNVELKITLNTWTIDNKIIKPNNVITVKNKELYIYNKTRFFIRSVTLSGDETSQTAVLTCVPPETFNTNTPNYFFKYNEDTHG